MNEQIQYWSVNETTREVFLEPIEAEFRGGKYRFPRNALLAEPLPPKQGFAVIALADLSGTEYIEDHRDIRIYNTANCNESKQVTKLGLIDEGWTSKIPATQWDEWINDDWVTNLSDKHIADYDQVDTKRRALYREVSDPLYMESYRKEKNGLLDEAADYKAQADAAVEKIQAENPWPVPPAS
ncbi:hypothetical protein RJD40_18875 [Vibrio scophthalmi]|uniref:hypothetical protein n=1 Tax=Vibrio scophthalmi TaxID=45658 RepID=UPI003AAC5345